MEVVVMVERDKVLGLNSCPRDRFRSLFSVLAVDTAYQLIQYRAEVVPCLFESFTMVRETRVRCNRFLKSRSGASRSLFFPS